MNSQPRLSRRRQKAAAREADCYAYRNKILKISIYIKYILLIALISNSSCTEIRKSTPKKLIVGNIEGKSAIGKFTVPEGENYKFLITTP